MSPCAPAALLVVLLCAAFASAASLAPPHAAASHSRRAGGPATPLDDSLGRIHVNGTFFMDDAGRVRIFHGFNAVQKGFPWYPQSLLNETQLAYYQKWGFNAVRLGTMWSGVYPAAASPNATYIATLEHIVNSLASHGMYSLLDMHQDVLSSLFGSYDGAPLWLVSQSQPSHPYPWPLENCCFTWAESYATEACGRAFQDIYDNVHASRQHMAAFWVTVASAFRNQTSILGYELINEPWAGDIYKYPELLLPGEAGSRNLQPLYDAMNHAIRTEAQDSTTIIFYEPVTWGMVFGSDSPIGSGFSHVPGGDQYRDRSAMSYHYYCWVDTLANGSAPYQPFERIACDRVLGPQVFSAVEKDIERIGGGSMLTEFGLCYPDGEDDENTEECDWVMDEADRRLQSWTYWDAGFFDSSGHIRSERVKSFARTYARAIAGVPRSMRFNVKTGHFSLRFSADADISASTEIVVPASVHYPNGFHVEVSDGLSWSDCSDSGATIICVEPSGASVEDAQVTVERKLSSY